MSTKHKRPPTGLAAIVVPSTGGRTTTEITIEGLPNTLSSPTFSPLSPSVLKAASEAAAVASTTASSPLSTGGSVSIIGGVAIETGRVTGLAGAAWAFTPSEMAINERVAEQFKDGLADPTDLNVMDEALAELLHILMTPPATTSSPSDDVLASRAIYMLRYICANADIREEAKDANNVKRALYLTDANLKKKHAFLLRVYAGQFTLKRITPTKSGFWAKVCNSE